MANSIPDEINVAKAAIETARTALEALFEKMEAARRAEKIMATQTLQEAVSRVQAAQELLIQLEKLLAGAP